MAMDSFPTPTASSTSNPPSNALNASLSSTSARPSSSSNDLEHLLRDSDSDGISLHSNLGATAHRRAKHRRRPKFSLTLFGYTLFGRPPIYLSDDDDGDDLHSRRARALLTNSSSTLDSDAAPLDREIERQRLEAEEEARRKAERRARRRERKARARSPALMSLTGASPHPDIDTFEGFQGSGMISTSLPFRAVEVISDGLGRDGVFDGSNASHSGDADDADLDGGLYTRKRPSGALSASGSDSRSRTSASVSTGDTSHIQNLPNHTTHQFTPYPHTEMHLPAPVRKKSHRASKRTSTVSSVTSQSTSTTPYTPVESIAETPAVAAFPAPAERYLRDGYHADFPSVGLSGQRRFKTLDPRAFLAHRG
ncbi:hypothetical protein HD554DRAFT_2177481 [Boletus coccyginus]|nr:hypothetical protein HD554DRAFT_2177481 [Boletus coccyginus]